MGSGFPPCLFEMAVGGFSLNDFDTRGALEATGRRCIVQLGAGRRTSSRCLPWSCLLLLAQTRAEARLQRVTEGFLADPLQDASGSCPLYVPSGFFPG